MLGWLKKGRSRSGEDGRARGEKLSVGVEHGFIVGQTRSGKTTLLLSLLGAYPRAVLFDVKHDINLHRLAAPARLASRPVELYEMIYEQGERYVVYRPRANGFKQLLAEHDAVCKIIYHAGGYALLDDEAAHVCDANRIGEWHYKLFTMGLARGCVVVTSTQRPVQIHNCAISEASWFIMFRLLVETHREKLAGVMPRAVAEAAKELGRHEFIFWHKDGRTCRAKLKLS